MSGASAPITRATRHLPKRISGAISTASGRVFIEQSQPERLIYQRVARCVVQFRQNEHGCRDDFLGVGVEMGQHKHPEPSLKSRLLIFVVGTFLAAPCIYWIVHFPMGFTTARLVFMPLGVGLICMIAPIWTFLRKKKQQH